MQSLHLDTVGPVEPARALADLVEISPQIEAAAVVTGNGELAGSVGVPDGRASVLARTVRELLEGAAERAIFAVTRERATPGLLFYDLKRCLAALEEEDAEE